MPSANRDDDLGNYWGAAYVFEREDGLWVEKQKLYASDGGAGMGFGYEVDLEGDLAVAADWPLYLTSPKSAAHVFSRGADGRWSEEAKLEVSDGRSVSDFGSAVVIARDMVIVGAEYTGEAYVFNRVTPGQWLERQALNPHRPGGYFGNSLDVDGDDLLVGSYHLADKGFSAGAVFQYQRDPVDRMEVAIDIKPGYAGNRLNLATQRRFWVAIFSDAGFDALQVEPSTVRLGPGRAAPNRYSVNDVNGDGLPDLMLRFQTPEVGIACGATELTLTGETSAGKGIVGTDKIKTAGC